MKSNWQFFGVVMWTGSFGLNLFFGNLPAAIACGAAAFYLYENVVLTRAAENNKEE